MEQVNFEMPKQYICQFLNKWEGDVTTQAVASLIAN